MNLTTHHSEHSNKDYIISSIDAKHVEELEELQRIVFPTLLDEERFHAAQYLKHIEIFPEGQLMVLFQGKVIAATSTLRYNFDMNSPYHQFSDIMGGGWLTTHQPNGAWLYGLDVSVHPAHRGKGLARLIYRTRHEIVTSLKLKGQVIVGMMSGYGKLKESLSAEEYFEKIKSKELFDPTVSVQMKMGFEPQLLIPNYLSDPICDDYGILLTLDKNKHVD